MNQIDIATYIIKGKDVQIIQEIKNIYVNEEFSFDKIYLGENKLIDLELKILYENKYAIIKYWILINKLENEYAFSFEKEYHYRKLILRQNSLFEISNQGLQNFIYYIISIIESIYNNPSDITADEYENINVENLLKVSSRNFDSIEYGIFIIKSRGNESFTPTKNIITFSYGNREVIIALFPLGYVNLHYANIDVLKDSNSHMHKYLRNSQEKKELLFKGNLDECKTLLNNNSKIKILYSKFQNLKDTSNNFSYDNWEKLYFDAVTDGNLGDFEDFHGDIDDVETWNNG